MQLSFLRSTLRSAGFRSKAYSLIRKCSTEGVRATADTSFNLLLPHKSAAISKYSPPWLQFVAKDRVANRRTTQFRPPAACVVQGRAYKQSSSFDLATQAVIEPSMLKAIDADLFEVCAA